MPDHKVSPQVDERELDDRLWGLVRRNLAGSQPAAIDDATPLLSIGLDSLGLMQLITDLEVELGVVTDEDDLQDENFETIAGLRCFVKDKLKAVR